MKIGRVTATERTPTTVDEFTFWLKDNVIVGPFDIVRVRNTNDSVTYGIIKEIMHVTDSAGHLGDYVSHDFGDIDIDPLTQRLGTTFVRVEVLSNNNDIFMPVKYGELVEFADEDDVRRALGLDNIAEEVPAGFIKMTNGTTVPIGFDRKFLIGPEGAHLNISGISGLATKTSYAMFLIQALQQKYQNKVAFIILNVKGQDLLRLDEVNPEISSFDENNWSKVGLACQPFEKVKYFYPFQHGQPNNAATFCDPNSLDQQFKKGFAKTFVFTYSDDREKLNLLFSNIDDPNFTLESIMTSIISDYDFKALPSWNDFFGKLQERSTAGGGGGKSEIRFIRLTRTSGCEGDRAGV